MSLKNARPSYRYHKARNCAVVTIASRNRYLGPYGSPESYRTYAELIAEHFGVETAPGGPSSSAGGDNGRPNSDGHGPTINELVLRYWKDHVAGYYTRNGRPTDRQHHIRLALRPLRQLYGRTPAAAFGPRRLKRLREKMIADGVRERGGLSHHYVNDHVGIIKRMFAWGLSEELVPSAVVDPLASVTNTHKGRDPRLRERRKIPSVPEDHVRAVLPVVSPQIRAMIELQWLTGMRPDEVTVMRPADIDTGGPVWLYTPPAHKMDYQDIDRVVALGPRAQQIVRPWLDRKSADYLFSPREAAEAQNAGRRQTGRRRTGRVNSARRPREHYDDASYRQAVQRGCRRAGVPKWSPGQLRHSAATRIRREGGTEAARLVLGHRTLSTTDIYTDKELAETIQIMQDLG